MATHALSAPPPASPSAPVPGPPPVTLKFILIGDAATGKTSLRERFIRDRFTGSYRATIGCDFLGRVVKVKRRAAGEEHEGAGGEDGEHEEEEEDEARLQIWDTAGQERFRSLAPAFYRSSDACLLLYSLASPDSPSKVANSITSWYNEFVSKCPVEDPRMYSWACVGTKADEVRGDPEREARTKEIQEAVEAVLDELLPRRPAPENGGRAPERKAARQARPPTVSVEVLPPRNSHDSAGRRRPFFQSRSSTAQSANSQADLPDVTVDGQPVAASKLDPDSTDRHPTVAVKPGAPASFVTPATTVGSSAAQTPKFELDAPIADLLVATSSPSAPGHFGPAGAPPAVYIGGPYRDPDGRVLGADGAQAKLEEGETAPDHRGDRPDGQGGDVGGGEDEGSGLDELQNGPDSREREDEDEDEAEGQGYELEREEARYEDEGIRHFRWTSAKTGEGVQDVFEYLARRVLAIRRAEALSEDEHAGTPYVRDSHPHRRHRHASGGGSGGAGTSPTGGEDKVIKLGERDKLSVGQRMKQACCA